MHKLRTFNLYVRMKPNSLFMRTAGGCLLKSSPGLSGLVTPAELTCTNLRFFEDSRQRLQSEQVHHLRVRNKKGMDMMHTWE